MAAVEGPAHAGVARRLVRNAACVDARERLMDAYEAAEAAGDDATFKAIDDVLDALTAIIDPDS